MANINVLDKSVAELIAAGEVIERPASVLKEMAENSIDSGATAITVEIRNGGITYIRISDNGCGIAHNEVPLAFRRHATSKLVNADDLYSIATLGFRGEALASVAAVGKVEVITKQPNSPMGTNYKIEGGKEILHEECGCPDGTTIIIRDLFFNTPARLKFLKKDVTEANQGESLIKKLALANPQISFKFIRDGKETFVTPGDGEYYSGIYSVFGKDFANSLIPVDNIYNNISVTGYASSPLFTRGNRTMQNFFLNGRYIRSPLCVAAVEEGYRHSIMVGKFPACVLNINIDPAMVDVNVHPAKTEVKFAEEKQIFNAMYLAIKNALLNYDASREIVLPAVEKKSGGGETHNKQGFKISAPLKQETEQEPEMAYIPKLKSNFEDKKPQSQIAFQLNSNISPYENPDFVDKEEKQQTFKYISEKAFEKPPEPADVLEEVDEEKPPLKVIGEIFKTYILCEAGEEMVVIDKHAAHERINYNRLKEEVNQSSQLLAEPQEFVLDSEEYNALSDNLDNLSNVGISLELLTGFKARLTGIPTMLDHRDGREIVEEIAQTLMESNPNTSGNLFDEILHSMACKASIRANDSNSFQELVSLAHRVYGDENIRFCPHGRPVMTKLTKKQLEKFFGRIQ